MGGADPGTYEAVAYELLADPAVVTGKLFVCEHEGELLIKLPPERLAELKRDGARDFEPMAGRRMNGWIKVPEPARDPVAAWTELAEEAKAFVAGAG